jgi:hypothetical protein
MTILIQINKLFKQPIDGFKGPPNGMCNMTLERSFFGYNFALESFEIEMHM